MRVLNGATRGNGAAAQISGAVKSVRFDWCDFMGNISTDGGAGGWGGWCDSALWERLYWDIALGDIEAFG